MKRNRLIGGALAATAITLLSLAGSSASAPEAVPPSHNYVDATFATGFPMSQQDLVLALSDLVDLERALRDVDPEEREKHQTSSSIPVLHDKLG